MNDQNCRYIIALGKVCVDEYYEANSWPNVGEKKFVKPMKKMIGGMVANAACVLSGYGVKTYLLDLLNNSTTTTEIIEDLNKYNVDTSLLIYDPSIADYKCIIFLVGGERIIFVVDDKRPKIRLNKEQLKMLAGAEYIYTTIPDLKELEQSFELISQLKRNGVKLAIDVEADSFIDRSDAEAYFALTDVLFLNDSAFDKYRGVQHYAEALEDLLSIGPHIIVVTRGADGCLVKTSEQEFTSQAHNVKVIDTTGAGDTFNSTFLYGILSGWDERKSAQFANGAAALAITKIGPRGGVRPIVEIEDFISKNTLSKE